MMEIIKGIVCESCAVIVANGCDCGGVCSECENFTLEGVWHVGDKMGFVDSKCIACNFVGGFNAYEVTEISESVSGREQEEIATSAIETIEWVTLKYDNEGNDLGGGFNAGECVKNEVRELVDDFIKTNNGNAVSYIAKLGTKKFGQDFVLTAQGHGAGFWDRGLGLVGDKLTAAAKDYSIDASVYNDDMIHMSSCDCV